MKIILAAGVTILALAALSIKKFRAHRGKILCGYALGIILLCVFYNFRTAGLILPFYSPVNQKFYQKEFAEEGVYPDALLPYLLKDKTISLPFYVRWDDSLKETYDHWGNGGMFCMNVINIIKACGGTPSVEEDDWRITTDAQKSVFTDMGYLNDTLRYSFFYNDIRNEFGNGFYYYWFYSASTAPFKLYVCPTGLLEDDNLCLIFDNESNFYLISKDYYEKEVIDL